MNATASIVSLPLKRCGNCLHAHRLDLKSIQCWGVPPTPIVVGGRPDALGRLQMQVELMRPQLQATEKACGQWEPATATEVDLSSINLSSLPKDIGI